MKDCVSLRLFRSTPYMAPAAGTVVGSKGKLDLDCLLGYSGPSSGAAESGLSQPLT